MSDPDEMAERLAAAILDARERPELFETHGLPLPTPERCRRVLSGYVPKGAEFPGRYRRFDPVSTLLGLDRICNERARFRFAEHGELGDYALIQPVSATGQPADNHLIDLVAWHPAQPDRWWLLEGLAERLGPWPDNGEARLVETPLAWLADPGSMCLLDFSKGPMSRLLELSRITVPERSFGTRLYQELRDLALPRIEVAG